MRKGIVIALTAVGVMAAGIPNEAQGRVQPMVVTPGPPESPNTFMDAPTMPPPVWRQPIPVSPGRGFVYVPGSWAWNGGGWVWVSGAWVVPPRPRAVWTPGRWNRRGRGARWIGGRWR